MDLLDRGDKYDLVGGAITDSDMVQFPAAIVAKDDFIYVASMSSADTRITADYEKASKETPNFTLGGIEKYGSQYGVVLEQYMINRDAAQTETDAMQKSFIRQWRKPFETAAMQSVYVSVFIFVGDDD